MEADAHRIRSILNDLLQTVQPQDRPRQEWIEAAVSQIIRVMQWRPVPVRCDFD